MIKNCKICGKEFDALRSTLTCSIECRKENARRLSAKHEKTRPCRKAEQRAYRQRPEVKAWAAEWYREWYQENKAKKDAYDRKWKADNAEHVRERDRKRNSKPAQRLVNNIRSRVVEAFKTQNVSKKNKTYEYLGCTGAELAEYLVHHYAWKPWFTLENYGEVWHIDHIKPLATFDLTDDAQAKQAFHYTNCQPLCATANIKKSSKWNGKKQYHGK